jgi:hypothetical protein
MYVKKPRHSSPQDSENKTQRASSVMMTIAPPLGGAAVCAFFSSSYAHGRDVPVSSIISVVRLAMAVPEPGCGCECDGARVLFLFCAAAPGGIMDMGCGFSFVHLGRLMEGMLMDWEREGWVALGLEDRRLERREKEGVMVRVSICRDCRCRRDEGWVKYMGRGE